MDEGLPNSTPLTVNKYSLHPLMSIRKCPTALGIPVAAKASRHSTGRDSDLRESHSTRIVARMTSLKGRKIADKAGEGTNVVMYRCPPFNQM